MSDEVSAAPYWSHHSEVDEAWAARRELAAAIRELSERCVRTEAGASDLLAAASAIRAATETLPAGDTSFQRFRDGRYGADPARFIDRTALTGHCNPVSPPLTIDWDGTTATCPITFTELQQGAPGMVHGGWVASAGDLARLAASFDVPESHAVLDQASIESMFSLPQNVDRADYESGDAYYGLGWSVRDYGAGQLNTWHGGSLPGTHTLMVRVRSGVGWVVLFNRRGDGFGEIDGLLHQAAGKVEEWPGS